MLRRLETRPPAPRPAAPPRALPLDPIETPHGVALCRVEEVALPPGVARAIEPAAGTVFLDTETTGLAGGTGTYVFLVGLGTWTRAGFRVTQYFLGDLGAEAAFLAAVRAALADARQLVTFNGRTFDLPLLETRYLLSRAPWWGAEIPHLDLYPMARALWRAHVADCRLTTLEAALLDLDRGDDLPGAMMPELYFRYLRSRDTRPLPRIFAHNRWDLLALAALAARADALLAGPDPRHDPLEWLGAARWLERRDPERSVAFYEAALGAGLPPDTRARAAWRLGRLWRRAGRRAEALALWAGIAAATEDAPLGLLVDLAKLQEHVARDFAAALRLTRRALDRIDASDLDAVGELVGGALGHRARRLERRLRGRVLAGLVPTAERP
ncbi:MAG TPA: ribonuclease H-like domain-containing protein [Methylomirabilota bacterium]|jgi:hypothetical protein|nr:ribonuclease H-like domain-containing protein [Methylomirabilota bacterium]